MSSLPLKPVRDLLAQDCPFHICDDAIVVLRDALEFIIHQVGHESLEQFERLNSNRKRQGLRRLRRLNSWAIRRAAQKIINEDSIFNMGSQPAMIENHGDTMHRHETVTKPKTTHHHNIVEVE